MKVFPGYFCLKLTKCSNNACSYNDVNQYSNINCKLKIQKMGNVIECAPHTCPIHDDTLGSQQVNFNSQNASKAQNPTFFPYASHANFQRSELYY